MAGCSIVVLTLLLWPVMLVGTIACVLFMATVEFVTSPAFPVLIAGIVCNIIAAVDVGRILWRAWKQRSWSEVDKREFKRPVIFIVIGFALFVACIVMTGGMLADWFRSIEEQAEASST